MSTTPIPGDDKEYFPDKERFARENIAKRAYETFAHRAGPMMFLPWEQLPSPGVIAQQALNEMRRLP